VEPESAPALAAGIRRLLADPDLRRRCVAGGHETVRRLGSWEDIAAETHRLFESIRSAHSSRVDASASNRG
jgi:glycosyltransferase involved in cell wall biosynthesis